MKRNLLFHLTLLLSVFCGVPVTHAQLTYASNRRHIQLPAEITQEKANTVIALLHRLEKTHQVNFVYQQELLEGKTVSVAVNENDKIESILKSILPPMNLKFKKLKGGGYTILPVKKNNSNADHSPIGFLEKRALPSVLIQVVEDTIKGKVTDEETGEGIPGVTILVKGTERGVSTDLEGDFAIGVPDKNAILVFSFVGYEKQEVSVGSGLSLNVALKTGANSLDEVVVVGFATQKKVSVTGAVSSVSTKDLVQSPVANISNSLVGRMPGLFAVQSSGEPGNDQSTLRIRGVGTFSGASDPLIMVDGIEVNNYNNIDPNEIENLTILKDASATAVYGVRGANGVLLITTKRGKLGKPQFSYTANVAATGFTDLRQGMNSADYARSFNEALKYDSYVSGVNYTPKYSAEAIAKYESGEDPVFFPNTDWYALTLKDQAFQTQHNLNISGGTEKVRYFVSGGFFVQGGQFNNTDLIKEFDANRKYNRYNFRSNFNFDITKRLRTAIDLSSQSENLSGANWPTVRVIEGIARANPLGSPGFIGDKIVNLTGLGTVTNPIQAMFAEGYNRQFRNFLQGSVRLDYDLDFIAKGLSVHGLANYQNNNNEIIVNRRTLIVYNAIKLPDGTVNFIPQAREEPFTFTQTIGKNRRTYAEFGIDYKRIFGEHSVTGLLNYNQTKRFDPTLAFLIPNGYQGVVGRATYGYKGRYLAEFTFGYNGTENFAPGQRFGFFPAYSLGWIPSEEPFFPKNDIITFLKIRGSYGEVGNDRIGGDRFLYRQSAYTQAANGYFFGEVGSTYVGYTRSIEGKLGNPDVTWERAIKQNVGVEMSFWKSKISITADYFSEKRDNILANLSTAPVTVGTNVGSVPIGTILGIGANLPAYNLGRMKNQGFDGDITYNDKVGSFNYFIKGNFTYARNIVEFQDEVPRPFDYQNRTGQPFGQFFGLVAEGLYNTWEEVNDASRPVSSWNNNRIQPGDIKYKDTNGDGILNDNDAVAIGYSNFPEKIFGVSVGGSFKGFDFSVLFQGADNVSLAYNRRQTRGFFENSGAVEYLLNSWSQERYDQGLPIWFPHLSEGDVVQKHNYQQSTFWVRDASYVRFKNLEIGYSFSKNALSKIRLGGVRIFVSGNNLYTWDNLFPGIDPENTPGITNEEPYPLTRTANFGLNVKF